MQNLMHGLIQTEQNRPLLLDVRFFQHFHQRGNPLTIDVSHLAQVHYQPGGTS